MAKLPAARIEVCADGAGALEWLADSEHAADLVFYDLALDWERGSSESAGAASAQKLPVEPLQMAALTQFIRWLRTQPELCTLPVIGIGPDPAASDLREQSDAPASARPEARLGRLVRALIDAGAIDYVSYSVESKSLMQTIETAPMRQRAITAEVQRQVEARYHDIIGIIQHQFRTPMTLLLGYGEYLRDALDDKLDKDELKLSVGAILSGSVRLNRLIESFLFLSELQYKRPDQLQVQRVAPAMLWREVQLMRRAEAAESPVEIVYAIPEDLPAAEIDPELVREALSRLLDNALQYTRPGSQEIRLRAETSGQWVRWIIEDEGTGIEADQLQQILEPFGRVQGKRFAPQSVGLSLAIVKRIAELHGGALTVESQVDEGSRFTLQLPRLLMMEYLVADDLASDTGARDAAPRPDDEPPPSKNGTYPA